MKAIVCTRYGKTEDVLEMRDMPTPVVQVGSGVTQFIVGDMVFARVASDRFGTFAEFIPVDEK